MLKNHFVIALRNLSKRKGYAFINITGLAVGMACCLLIVLFVTDELRYDQFHAGADRIYRAEVTGQAPKAPPDRFASSSRPMGAAIRSDFAEVEHVVRLTEWDPTVRHNGSYFFDDTFFYAEPELFQVFSFPLVEGDPATALRDPYTLVLTESMAEKYFGGGEAVGQSLVLNDTLTFTVTGVAADVPAHSHFTFDFLTSWSTFETIQPIQENEWLSLNSYTYLRLRPGVEAGAFEAKLADLITRNFSEILQRINIQATVELHPLTRIYLHSQRMGEIGRTSDVRYIYAFSAIAVFVLLIACINFMNLSTARSMERAREVGVRKVAGSSRGMLIRQFLSESLVVAFLALLIAVLLVWAALPFFNTLAEKSIRNTALAAPVFVAGLLGFAILVGLLSGSYPAFVLSRFRPVEVLKGSFQASRRGVLLRQALVVFQFAISVVLIAGTLIVFRQLDYMRNQPLGFDKEQVLVVDASGIPGGAMQNQYSTAKQEFMQHPFVTQVAATNGLPGRGNFVQIVFPEGLPENDSRRAQMVVTDHDFVETLGLEMAAGRDFSEDFGADEYAVLVNEAAVANFGWSTPEDALGKQMNFGNDQQRTVIGVLQDYHYFGLQRPIEPTVVFMAPASYDYFAVRLETNDLSSIIDRIEQTWTRLFPGYTFDYFFLDDDFDRQYANETRLTRIFGAFALIAVLIACLGLFGLASFITAQRTKEIGVRKVLGASVPGVVLLLTKGFAGLVLIAIVLAVPIAYFGMRRWLDGFAYHTDLGPGVFLLAGVLALAIALLTVSYQAVRAALTDPVKALRYE